MDLSVSVLGVSTAHQLQTRNAAAVLTIGRDVFTRADLAAVSCFNYVAALNLSRALADLGAKSVKDVFDHVTPQMLAVPRIGAVSLAVLGAAFEQKGLGGSAPLVAWVMQHHDPAHKKAVVTFDTIKHHAAEMRAATNERRAAKTRARTRRESAHRLRVDRHLRRVGA